MTSNCQFWANEISWILLLTNERARKLTDNLSNWIKFSFSCILTPQFPLHQGPARLTISVLCVCPLIDDDFRNNIVKIAVDPLSEMEMFKNIYPKFRIEEIASGLACCSPPWSCCEIHMYGWSLLWWPLHNTEKNIFEKSCIWGWKPEIF